MNTVPGQRAHAKGRRSSDGVCRIVAANDPGIGPSVLARAKAGDGEAFDRLVALHQEDLRRFVGCRIPGREDAADLCQDVLVRAYMKLNQVRGRSTFRTWLLAIAKRAVADFYRSDHAFRFVNGDRAGFALDSPEDENPQVHRDSVAESCEARQQIGHCLACLVGNLSLEEHVAVVLCDIYGFNDGETSRIMAKSLGAFKHLLHRARARMDQVSHTTCALVRKTGDAAACEARDHFGRHPPGPPGTPRTASSTASAQPSGTDALLSLRAELVRETESLLHFERIFPKGDALDGGRLRI